MQPDQTQLSQTQLSQTQLSIVPLLLAEMYTEAARGRNIVPMAALCKRLELRMSTLQRHLTGLAEHGLVEVYCDEAGRWTTTLTDNGMAIFNELAA